MDKIEFEQQMLAEMVSAAAALVSASDMHDVEGVYEVMFSFELNTEDLKVKPLDPCRVSKLRGKTND